VLASAHATQEHDGQVIPGVRRLGPALDILRRRQPKDWPEAIAAIQDSDERLWADHWLRQQAQILRFRRAMTAKPAAGREERDRHSKAQREQRRR